MDYSAVTIRYYLFSVRHVQAGQPQENFSTCRPTLALLLPSQCPGSVTGSCTASQALLHYFTTILLATVWRPLIGRHKKSSGQACVDQPVQ